MGEDGTLESWEYQGGTFTATGSWLAVGGKKVAELEDKLYNVYDENIIDYSEFNKGYMKYNGNSNPSKLDGSDDSYKYIKAPINIGDVISYNNITAQSFITDENDICLYNIGLDVQLNKFIAPINGFIYVDVSIEKTNNLYVIQKEIELSNLDFTFIGNGGYANGTYFESQNYHYTKIELTDIDILLIPTDNINNWNFNFFTADDTFISGGSSSLVYVDYTVFIVPKNASYCYYTVATAKEASISKIIDIDSGGYLRSEIKKNAETIEILASSTDAKISEIKDYILDKYQEFTIQNNQELPLQSSNCLNGGYYFSEKGDVLYTKSADIINYCVCIDYISVNEGEVYELSNYKSYNYIVFYDKDKNTIETYNPKNSTIAIPASIRYMRVGFDKTDFSYPILINKSGADITTKLETEDDNIKAPLINYGCDNIGISNAQPLPAKGYSHIIFYGQSICEGGLSVDSISTEAQDGCYMIGNGPDDNKTIALNPLISNPVLNSRSAESPVVGCTNALKSFFNNTHLHDLKLIGSFCGEGNRSVTELSKDYDDGNGVEKNIYHTKFLQRLNAAKSLIVDEQLSCSNIFYAQGENDSNTDKETYKNKLLQLKNDMQSDIMSIYGQSYKPMFFLYQTCNMYVAETIAMAQYEFAQENDDVWLVSPHYFYPTEMTGTGHLCANGYRWFGEDVARTIINAIFYNRHIGGVELRNIFKEDNKIIIDTFTPTIPLVIDTYTSYEKPNYGFEIRDESNLIIPIKSVDVVANRIILTLYSRPNNIKLRYACDSSNKGAGNIRDSDTWMSFFTYVDDDTLTNIPPYKPKTKDGESLSGKKYPLFNALQVFSVVVE